MAVSYGLCLQTPRKRSRLSRPSAQRNSPHLLLGAQGQRLGEGARSTAVWAHRNLAATLKRRKLKWFGHIKHHDGLLKTILRSTLKDRRRRGRQRICWTDNIKPWTSLSMSELPTVASGRRNRLEEDLR